MSVLTFIVVLRELASLPFALFIGISAPLGDLRHCKIGMRVVNIIWNAITDRVSIPSRTLEG